jgi:poly-beta-1,6-N-acetyl-D-glucosamine synthase
MKAFNRYFIITPARNEEKLIEKTIQSVVTQTIKPVRWSIVSDGSTDRTDEIAGEYAKRYPFIQVLRTLPDPNYNFSSKVRAFNHAFALSGDLAYDFIGNIDADVSFGPDYFESILGHFSGNPKLGLAGGFLYENIKGQIKPLCSPESINSVSGAVQLFRKECFASIGGYIPIAIGGIDSAAEISARARGWTVQTYPEIMVMHLKPMRTGAKSILSAKFRQGRSNYQLGYHPLFQVAVSVYHLYDRPFILGGIFLMAGYLWSLIRRDKKRLAPDVMGHLRKEQLTRLFKMVHR